jgi:hypothetical protein
MVVHLKLDKFIEVLYQEIFECPSLRQAQDRLAQGDNEINILTRNPVMPFNLNRDDFYTNCMI